MKKNKQELYTSPRLRVVEIRVKQQMLSTSPIDASLGDNAKFGDESEFGC